MNIKKLTQYLKHLISGPRFYLGGEAAVLSSRGGGSSQPAQNTYNVQAPDPYATAAAQQSLNQNTANFDAQLNRYTQNNPFGQISWTNTGSSSNPQWTQNTTLSAPQQSLYNTQLGTQNQFANAANNNVGNLTNAIGNGAPAPDHQTFNQVKDSLFTQLQPGLDHSRQMLETKLANQGLNPGSEAYTNAMRDFGNQENNAYLSATSNAMNQMAQEQGMANAYQNQAITNQGALNQFSGNVNMPTYGGSTAVNGGTAPDIAGLINSNYQNQLNSSIAANNVKQAGKNSGISSGIGMLGTIGGAAIKASSGGLRN